MPFLNFESRHFSDAEKAAISTALQDLQTALAGKIATLTPEERQQYGSINEQNKLLVNKIKDYRDNNQQLSSPEVDWEEFGKDYDRRSFLQSVTNSTGFHTKVEDMIFLTSNLGLHNLKFEIKDGKNEILSIKNGLWNHKGSKY